MTKRTNPLFTALLFAGATAATAACGAAEVDDLIDESAALAISSDDPDADANTEDALGANDMDLDEAARDQTDARVSAEPQAAVLNCDFIALRAQIRDRFDENGDGVLDRSERAELRDHLDDHPRIRVHRKLLLGNRRPHLHVWQRVKWAFDADGDGALSAEERAELIAASEARCERRRAHFVERFDSDQDGALSEAELRAGLEELRSKWQEKKADFLARWDVDGDGALDDAERAALREELKSKRDEIRTRIKELFDADDSGDLSSEELAALKAELRRRYVEGFSSGS